MHAIAYAYQIGLRMVWEMRVYVERYTSMNWTLSFALSLSLTSMWIEWNKSVQLEQKRNFLLIMQNKRQPIEINLLK